MDPVSAALPEAGVTVAVNVTAWPYVEGFSEDVSPIVVDAGLTVWMSEFSLPV